MTPNIDKSMKNFSIIPTAIIYSAGIVWCLWFIYQPIKNDLGITFTALTIVFYLTFAALIIKTKNKLLTFVLTSPIFIFISTVIVGMLWYIVALSLGIE